MFQEERAARPEVLPGSCGDPAYTREAVVTTDQGNTRLETHVASFQMWISGRNIGRVAYDEIARVRADRLEPIAPCKVDLDRVFLRVAPRDVKRFI